MLWGGGKERTESLDSSINFQFYPQESERGEGGGEGGGGGRVCLHTTNHGNGTELWRRSMIEKVWKNR
jgi:hypothetical protein